MPPTQYPLSGKAAPPPNSRDAFPSLQQGADPLGWGPRGPTGTPGRPRVPKGAFGALGGEWAHGAPWVIPKPFRMEPRFDWMVITKRLRIKTVAGKPSERKGFKVLPKPLEDQGGLGSEIMPRWCMGSIGREITKQFVPKLTIW